MDPDRTAPFQDRPLYVPALCHRDPLTLFPRSTGADDLWDMYLRVRFEKVTMGSFGGAIQPPGCHSRNLYWGIIISIAICQNMHTKKYKKCYIKKVKQDFYQVGESRKTAREEAIISINSCTKNTKCPGQHSSIRKGNNF